MRRVDHLFPQFCSFSNLLSAWRKTRRGSGRSTESAVFFQHLEPELLSLRTGLGAGSWRPGPFRFFDIFDPKHRTIAVAPFRDRVVHHALVNVLEPVFEPVFIRDSYATRTDKGVHAAVARAQYFLRDHDFFLKSDIDKFFDSVSHDRLMALLERKIKDRRLLSVCETIVRHGGKTGHGLPIGNRTSQFWANVYLDPLDHFVKERLRVKGYVRYMDDFVLFGHDKQQLKAIGSAVEDFLHEKLSLRLKPGATFLNRPANGLSFLGRRIFPNLIRLRHENLRRMTRRMALRERQLQRGELDENAFLHSMNSYWAMLSYYPELLPLRKRLSS